MCLPSQSNFDVNESRKEACNFSNYIILKATKRVPFCLPNIVRVHISRKLPCSLKIVKLQFAIKRDAFIFNIATCFGFYRRPPSGFCTFYTKKNHTFIEFTILTR
jgi:hypothetical protein